MPVLAGAPHADRTAVLGGVGNDDDLRAARHAPSFAEDVELDLAKTAAEGNLLWGRDVLIVEEDHAVIIVGPLDRGECLVVDGSGQIDTADLGAERGAGRDNLNRHRRFSCWSGRAVSPREPAQPPGAYPTYVHSRAPREQLRPTRQLAAGLAGCNRC